MSIDPVTTDANNGSSFNRYAYANNNPYSYLDPDGRNPVAIGLLVGGGVLIAGAVITSPAGKAEINQRLTNAGNNLRSLGNAIKNAISSSSSSSSSPITTGTNPGLAPGAAPGTTSTNSNPYNGPVADPVVVVDQHGNGIPVGQGERIAASPNGDFQQVIGTDGKPTGVRSDRGGHPGQKDPRAQAPHGHRPGVTTPDGNPHLPIEPKASP